MKVYKFGGASVKSAEAIRKVCKLIEQCSNEKLLVVVSAMGKTTNHLEAVLVAKLQNQSYQNEIKTVATYHTDICHALFPKEHSIFSYINHQIEELQKELEQDYQYDQLYDQVVSKGELLSSAIISSFLDSSGLPSEWIDAREYIRTDNNYREGRVDWRLTEELIRHDLLEKAEEGVLITQGFIGMSQNHFTTTLGREGSDFSAAIFAYCLPATSVTVWKDVPGILNADPKLIPEAELFERLHYKEAAEMTYYGASVIHPKTIKPLANKSIPLYVKSFEHPDEPGTLIHNVTVTDLTPSIIIKKDQCLVSFKVLDYTFIHEENLSLIFGKISEAGLKINIMQNSAISFSVVVDYDTLKLNKLVLSLKDHFEIRYNTGLKLITVKNYKPEIINKYRIDQKILLEQISRNNFRALVV